LPDDGPLRIAKDGLRVAIRLSPRAKADRLVGIAAAAEGRRILKAAVTAPPESGRANEALLQLLARAWQLPRLRFSIVQGASNRDKTVRVAGDPERLLAKITSVVAGLPGW
jgi:uncharacterized protein (TIGR00251 family)